MQEQELLVRDESVTSENGAPKVAAITYDEMNLREPVKRALRDMKFNNPTDVQAKAIPILVKGKDLIVQSRTGTGKTAGFGVPILENISVNRHLQALVLVPTRELALQVTGEIQKLAKYSGVKCATVYGGASMNVQVQDLRSGAQIVVGTPGRVIDHIKRETIRLGNVKTAVLDEADRMLDMGFIDDVNFILSKMPADKQTVLFSATMPPEILKLTAKFMKNPEKLMLSADKLTVDMIEQKYYDVENYDKFYLLTKVLAERHLNKTLVFRRTQRTVDALVEKLRAKGIHCEAIHGGLRQSKRESVMKMFRSGKIQVLVATDVAARGLDVKDVEHVINYDCPEDAKAYVHRIGRTGRVGAKGEAITFVTRENHRDFQEIMMVAKNKIAKQKFPGEKKDKGVEFLNPRDLGL